MTAGLMHPHGLCPFNDRDDTDTQEDIKTVLYGVFDEVPVPTFVDDEPTPARASNPTHAEIPGPGGALPARIRRVPLTGTRQTDPSDRPWARYDAGIALMLFVVGFLTVVSAVLGLVVLLNAVV